MKTNEERSQKIRLPSDRCSATLMMVDMAFQRLPRLDELDTILVIRTIFILQATSVILFHGLPHLNRYLSYGPRSSVPEPNGKVASDIAEVSSSIRNHTARRFLDRVILYPVPHSYFSHFYIASVLSSLIWGFQILSKGSLLRFVSQNLTIESSAAMSREQIILVWSLVTIQGIRRLWETVTLTKKSVSTMPVAHYVVGLLYYLALGVGIWIEGTPTILSTKSPLDYFTFSAPSIRSIFILPIFIFASGAQNDCSRYLASLPKYTLPEHPIFQDIICPHYTAECLIYLSLTILAAPKGSIINKTIGSMLLFCTLNLGATADATKAWYISKFGSEKVSGRWRMIPKLW